MDMTIIDENFIQQFREIDHILIGLGVMFIIRLPILRPRQVRWILQDYIHLVLEINTFIHFMAIGQIMEMTFEY